MACRACENAVDMNQIAYYRIGNSDIGYGEIGLIGCNSHIKLALDRLNSLSSTSDLKERLKKEAEKKTKEEMSSLAPIPFKHKDPSQLPIKEEAKKEE